MHPGRGRGFTLVELLVVIAIVTILMTAGAIGINNLSSGKGVGSAVSQAEAVFNLARSIAVSQNTTARVLIAKKLTSTGSARHPDDLRRMLIVFRNNETNRWELSDRGEFLPSGVFFSQTYSLDTADQAIPSETFPDLPQAFRGEYFFYEFNAEGIATVPGSGFVVGSGNWPTNDPSPRLTNAGKRDFGGFVIWRNGRTSLYRNPSQIGVPASPPKNF
jgi:prepilin-type N-terminal cleavage/methylation domain-containing protein